MRSPLRYPGGKSRVAKEPIKHFPKDIKHYYEPLAGGCSVGLLVKKLNLAQVFYMNDRDYHVWNFWDKMRLYNWQVEAFRTLQTFLGFSTEIKKEIYYQYRSDLLNFNKVANTREFENAIKYFFVNRCSFSGAGIDAGFSSDSAEKRFTRSSLDNLTKTYELIAHTDWNFSCLDYEECLSTANYINDRCFVFLDPPYYGIKDLYPVYTLNSAGSGSIDKNSNFDHKRLSELLKQLDVPFLLTYNDCMEVRELFNWAKIEEIEFHYSMSKKQGKMSRTKGKELIIKNYE